MSDTITLDLKELIDFLDNLSSEYGGIYTIEKDGITHWFHHSDTLLVKLGADKE